MASLTQVRLVNTPVSTPSVVLFLFSASSSSAQTQPTVPTLQNASSVAVPGYISLSIDEGGELQVSRSDVQAKSSSPMFHTLGLRQGQSEAGLQAVHAETSLTEIVNYHRNTLTELGFERSVETMSRYEIVYAFENGDRDLIAVL